MVSSVEDLLWRLARIEELRRNAKVGAREEQRPPPRPEEDEFAPGCTLTRGGVVLIGGPPWAPTSQQRAQLRVSQ